VRTNQLIHPKIFIKATLLFFSANALNLSSHELSHALTAYFFRVPATLFHFYVDINQAEATISERMIIAMIGPVFSLCLGILSWTFYLKNSALTTRLFLLYSAVVGISIFFGNLFSTAFAGDFSKMTQLLHFSQSLRYFISVVGLLALILFMFLAGRKFLGAGLFEPTPKGATILNGLFIPWVLGTALLILVYIPLPPNLVTGIIASSAFWIFSIVGGATGKPSPKTVHLSKISLSIWDIVLFSISVVVVRLLVPGIHFNP